jgi:hypothetical protein
MSSPLPYNPHLTTPAEDSPIANQWWSGLSFDQQQFISAHYWINIGISPYTILLAYRNRSTLRALPDWPETTFTKI